MILTPEERRAVVALAVLLVFGQAVSWWEARQAARPDRELSNWLTTMARLRALEDSVGSGPGEPDSGPGNRVAEAPSSAIDPAALPAPSESAREFPPVQVLPRSQIPPGILETGRLRINEATATQLETLSGVGPALARRILEARDERPFSSVDDLLRVPGIGPRTLERLRPQIEVTAAAADSS